MVVGIFVDVEDETAKINSDCLFRFWLIRPVKCQAGLLFFIGFAC